MQRQQRIEPGPGQESVWDYPRPPRLEDSNKHIQVICNGVVIAETQRAKVRLCSASKELSRGRARNQCGIIHARQD